MVDRRDLFLTTLVAIASIVSAIIGGLLVNQGVTDQWDRQISFDKQGAAQQFSIEISSLNDTLQTYATLYSQNKDLTCGGSEVNIDPNKITVLMLGDEIPYELVFNNRSITAYKGYPNYSSGDPQIYVVGFKFPNAPKVSTFQSCQISTPIIPPTLYNEHGMYYAYVKDIPKFEPTLARNLNTFYNKITTAETDRQYIQNYLDSRNDIPIGSQSIRGQYFSAYMDMRMNVIDAAQMEPEIKQELETQSQNNQKLYPSAISTPSTIQSSSTIGNTFCSTACLPSQFLFHQNQEGH